MAENRIVEQGLRRCLIFWEVKICTTDGSAFLAASRNSGGIAGTGNQAIQRNELRWCRRLFAQPFPAGVLTTKERRRKRHRLCKNQPTMKEPVNETQN